MAVTYSLKYQARVLVALPCDTISSKWLVGTTALREENEVRLLQYDQDNEQLVCRRTFTHAAEVWDIAPHPNQEDLFVTVWAKGRWYAGNSSATLWRAPPGSESGALEQQVELTGQTSSMRCALWSTPQPETVVTVEEGHLKKWAITEAGAEAVSSCPAGELVQLWGGALHPRNASLLCTAGSNDVQTWDLRTLSRPMGEIKMAHKQPVRSISFAPHADTRILTAGDDCKLRYWDLRNPGQPLLEMGHAAPAGPKGATRGVELDGKVVTWDEHEDSVYGLAWSASDPWLLASLSFDGRVALSKVPKNIKYKILI
eukprot:XP_001699948.1 predicted protein [Chlamydomonas reinhardtii]